MTQSQIQVEHLERYDGEAIYGTDCWGDPEQPLPLRDVRDWWILPQIGPQRVVAEIGCGGGRWSRYFQSCKLAYLIDATPKAEQLIRKHFKCEAFRFLLSPDGNLPEIPDSSVDYVFSFDVFVHFHRELFDAYLGEIARILKPNGVLHLHHAAEIGAESNPECFQYRDWLELDGLMKRLGFHPPSRRTMFTYGFGSILAEWTRPMS